MDTVKLKLFRDQAGNIDLLEMLVPILSNISEHKYSTGLHVVGWLDNMRMVVCERWASAENSLTKYGLGNNIAAMRLLDNLRAIEKLSDNLHVPMHKANLTKFHFAHNILLDHEMSLYLNYLGNIPQYNRFQHSNGINYKQKNGSEFALYDKIAEMKSNRERIPPLYIGREIMRLEDRHPNMIAKRFNMPLVTGAHLYDPQFYLEVITKWHNSYQAINKQRLYKTDMSMIKTKEQYKSLGVLELVNKLGGELIALQDIEERFKKRELTKKQAHDQRELVKACCRSQIQTCENDLIIELDRKIEDAATQLKAEKL